MIGACVECGETDDLHAGCGLCDLCVSEFAQRASQAQDDIASGRALFDAELMADFFEVDGYGNIS